MRILYVTTVGSTMGFFKDLISRLVMKGDKVDISCNYSQYKVPKFFEDLKCNIISIDCERSPLRRANIHAIKQIHKIVKDGSYDIVHCHTPVAAICTRIACSRIRSNELKVFYTAHGFHFFRGAPIKNWLIYFPAEWICSWLTDLLITINKEDFELAKHHLHAKRTIYVPGVGVDISRFELDPDKRREKRKELGLHKDDYVLLSVGELHERKNPMLIIDALGIVKNSNPEIYNNLRYLAVGEGHLKDDLEERAIRLGVRDKVHFLGQRDDVPELCAAADCFIHPSVREGLGIAPLEAMASGLPLICSTVQGIKDYARTGVTGICIDPHNANDLSNAIVRMYSDEEFSSQCAKKNPIIANEFSIDVATEAMLQVYREYSKQ